MDYKISRKAYRKSLKYIRNRMNGLNKTESARLVGYGSNTSIAEKTNAYKVALKDILEKNTNKINTIGDLIERDIEDGLLDKVNVKDKVDIQLKMAQIHKILTPQVTIKEEMMKDGSTKRTTWGQGSVAS